VISIIIPVLNEEVVLESSILKLISYTKHEGIDAELLIVDNGSRDRTAELARGLEIKYPSLVRYLYLPNPSPGLAFQLGVKEAKNELLVTLDADLSSDLSFLKHAVLLLPQVDCVIGAKTFGRQRRTLFRVLGSQTFILCTQLLFDIPIADFSMGTKAFRRSDILPILSKLDHWTGYILELIIYLSIQHKKIIQISVDCEDTRESHFNLFHEAQYRFRHLYRMRRLVKDKQSWINLQQ
jgi:glycosyltransferase involved in cell wall biosynthesis